MGRPMETVEPTSLNAAGRGPDRGLGRAVHVVNLALEDLAQMMDERRGNGLAAEQHLLERAQRGKGARIERQHARQRWRHLQMRDAVARDFVGDGCRTFVAVDDDGESTRQRPEQLEHRNIERHAGDGQPDAGLAADGAIHAGEEIHHVAVLDHHAFGLARRAGGVDHVGEVRGRGGERRRLPSFRGPMAASSTSKTVRPPQPSGRCARDAAVVSSTGISESSIISERRSCG